MAEDSRTPVDPATGDAPAPGTDPASADKPVRRRRRAGAPVGAPSVVEESPAEPHAPRTSVPEQSAAAPAVEEKAPERPRRRAGAPAGPPSIPVFSAAEPAHATVPAASGADDEGDADDVEDKTLAENTQPAASPTGDERGDEPQSGDIAQDLADLAGRRSTRRSRSGADEADDAARRERAQLDFSSLLFQAPAARSGQGTAADAADGEGADAQGDGEARDEDQQERSEGGSRSRSRSRGRGSRSGRSGGASDDADETMRPAARASDDPDDADEVADGADRDDRTDGTEDTEDGGSSRRRRRRGGRGRRGRGRGDDDTSASENEDPDDSADDASDSDDEGRTDSADGDDEGTEEQGSSRRARSRSSRSRRGSDAGRADDADADDADGSDESDDDSSDEGDGEPGSGSSSRRRRRRRRSGSGGGDERPSPDDPPNTVVKVRERRDEVKAVKGSTRLEAKKQRRREGRDAGRRRSVVTEAEFLARRESVKRSMIVRERPGRTQIAVLEDDVLVEHYVAQKTQTSMVGNVYLGKVQNVLPSMEAAFVDIGKGRNAVLYAGEVNWDAAGLEGQPRRIELALKSGDPVLVQVTKDPIGHKGARLTSQVSLPGRYVVLVPGGSMTGISRKLPDNERARLKKIMKQVIPEGAGVIVRTAAEGASEEELTRDVERLRSQWESIEKAQKAKNAPVSLSQEPDLAIKVVRDVFNEDFTSLIVEGEHAYQEVHEYVSSVAPDLLERVTKHVGEKDAFAKHRVDEQLLKAMDRKVYLPSGGSLVIDRTEAMTVIDVNTGKFTGSGGSLEETVTRNNLEAAEEVVRQLRLRDIGGIIVVDFIDMVLESNRDLVLRRLVECLGRDRTKHQVAEVTSLGLVQMTRKRVGQGLVETFSTTCESCNGRGVHIDIDGRHHAEPAEKDEPQRSSRRRSGRKNGGAAKESAPEAADGAAENVHRLEEDTGSRELARATIASIAAATTAHSHPEVTVDGQVISVDAPEQDSTPEAPAAEVTSSPAIMVDESGDAPAQGSESASEAPGTDEA
ncbi:Rne/Rng family ribonuclease [Brachybacterium huguangmaarense]